MHRLGTVLLVLTLLPACGGQVDTSPAEATGGYGAFGGGASVADSGVAPSYDGAFPGQDLGSAGAAAVSSQYVEQACPELPPPPVLEECDLFAPYPTCPSGQACYPFVDYPDPNDDCAQEVYGTICAPEGSDVQGDPCTAGSCAGGYTCVLTGEGTQCVQLCPVFGENTCPPGFICHPIDVAPGVGGCY